MLTARSIVAEVQASPSRAAEIVTGRLSEIRRLDGDLRAWAHVDDDGAGRSAGALKQKRASRLRLAGVPVGIKDIIDVAGMPTRAGAAAFAHRTPSRDASVVAKLRRAGAIVLGKTATTQFAYLDPAETRNPWNIEHTPGGSSSGSAAAVAAGMVPIALGSQTVGSVLRPAAFCGVVGFKPSYGSIAVDGVVPLAASFDHIGIFARSVADAALAYSVCSRSRRGEDTPFASPGKAEFEDLRIGELAEMAESRAIPEVAGHVAAAARQLRSRGAFVEQASLPNIVEWLECGGVVMAAEAAAFHEATFADNRGDYGHNLTELIESGLQLPSPEYVRAMQTRDRLRSEALSLLKQYDALLLPVAPGTAPRGIGSTGDPAFCAPASFAGLPSVSLPSGLDRTGLPLAVQLIGRPGRDGQLLRIATRVEKVLEFTARPGISATD